VAEVVERVVDWRRREEKDLLLAPAAAYDLREPVVARPRAGSAVVALATAVAKVVGLVDDDRVGQARHLLERLRELAAPVEIGVVEDVEVREDARTADSADVGEVRA
jgi:hypothetical protein